MPHTLVTGANGFVAAHVIAELISNGHTVTGAVRRASAGEDLLAEFPQWKDNLDFVVIDDYANEAALDKLFQEHKFDYIVHTAAPMPSAEAVTDYDKYFLRPAIDGNTTLLKSAKAYAKDLKSIAITGSVNAITMGNPEDNKARSYTNEMWNDITPEFARESNSAFVMYCSSKKEAELAIWDFVKKEKPDFTVCRRTASYAQSRQLTTI
jgi:nucleoside-diphosphate-sugar epimerase